MQRAIVIGCPGSGKSVFARALAAATGLPLHHLDMMNWNPDRTTVPDQVFLDRLNAVLDGPRWIIDGNYRGTIELRMRACDAIFFLDYPTEVCLEGVLSRQGRLRPDMPWIERPGERDEKFLDFIRNYPRDSRPGVLALLEKYRDREIHAFKSRREADRYLEELRNNPEEDA